jgi:hypothetical protein
MNSKVPVFHPKKQPLSTQRDVSQMVNGLEKKAASLQIEEIHSHPDNSQQTMTGPPTATTNSAGNSTPEILTTFIKFPELPIEIQRIVWNHALATAYVIRARENGEYYGQRFRHSIIPVGPNSMNIRRICNEAREEALRVQVPYFVG